MSPMRKDQCGFFHSRESRLRGSLTAFFEDINAFSEIKQQFCLNFHDRERYKEQTRTQRGSV